MKLGIDSATLVNLAIGLTLAEGIAQALWRRFARAAAAPPDFVANLSSGLALMLALRCALQGTGAAAIAALLALAGLAHGLDLLQRRAQRVRAEGVPS